MKIGVIGSGIVGQVLANGFNKHGHQVILGTNSVAKHEALSSKLNAGISIENFDQTANKSELIVLAVKGTAAEEVIKSIADKISGKIVIDTTNPIAESPPVNGVLSYFTDMNNESLMERLIKIVPEAKFVKAFNSIGNAYMVNPDFSGIKPAMFICGNDNEAVEQVANILDTFGFSPENMGKAEAARAIEPLCILWCLPGFIRNQWSHAFALLKK